MQLTIKVNVWYEIACIRRYVHYIFYHLPFLGDFNNWPERQQFYNYFYKVDFKGV